MHANANLLVHVVWSIASRAVPIQREVDGLLAKLLMARASRLRCRLIAVGIAPDHVHVLARQAPATSLSTLVQHLKGGGAHDFNELVDDRHRLKWRAGYWAETFGPADFTPLVQYVIHQRTRHDDSHPAEQWKRQPAEGGL